MMCLVGATPLGSASHLLATNAVPERGGVFYCAEYAAVARAETITIRMRFPVRRCFEKRKRDLSRLWA